MAQSGPTEPDRDVLVTLEIAPWVDRFAAGIAWFAVRLGCTELPGWLLASAAWLVARFGCRITPR
jgi:hypothetical protein